MSKLDGTEVQHAAHMQPCPGGPEFQLRGIEIGIYEAERLIAVSAVLPFPGEGVQVLESPMGHRNGHLPGDALVGTLLLHQSFSGWVAEEQVSPRTMEGQLVLCQWVQPPWRLRELAGKGAQAQGSPAPSS